ncbi:tetratricopeptide repeat protein [candidate division WOR-3 bacterium]|nr:tetratricopeptide repeat protein [candidate division WOR-3 bacterium]
MPKKKAKPPDKVAELEAKLAKLGDKGKQGIEKVDVLNQLAGVSVRKDLEQTKKYADKALKLALQMGYEKGIAKSYLNIGLYFEIKSDYSKAYDNAQKGLELSLKLDDKELLGSCYNVLGGIYKNKGELDRALESHIKALEYRESLGDKLAVASSYGNIGTVYYHRKNYKKALEHFNEAMEIFKELGNKPLLGVGYSNAGNAYMSLGDLDKALDYHHKALEICYETGDKHAEAFSTMNIGSIYKEKGDLDKALKYQLKSMKIFKDRGEQNSLIWAYSATGQVLIRQKKYTEASEYLHKGLKLAREIGAKQGEADCLKYLTELNEAQEDYEKALKTYKQYQELNEKIFNEESTDKINQLKLEFETEQKAKETEIFRLKNVELEAMVAERTIKLRAEVAERQRTEMELEEKLNLILKQREAIMELSTPVIKIWDGILVIPLIGVLDSRRTQHLTRELLSSISSTQSKIVIIDITGVPTVDSEIANHLVKTIESVKLLGSKCSITGIRPEVAQTIIHLGIDITQLETRASLVDGLKWAFRKIGKRSY